MGIRVLSQEVISRIAAGEVVERPASVVKELVENSLDAGARQVSVEVRGGGTSLIRVIDNGGGIAASDVELAFQRHATSKLASLDELDSIHTLGFRGEALPSIASVAEVELATCVRDETAGTLIKFSDGRLISRESAGRSPGTTVTVRRLFGAVPARRKFLKSAGTENSHVASVVSQYALAYPEVRFVLLIEGRVGLGTPGTGELCDAASEVYGAETARRMIAVGGDDPAWEAARTVRVSGLVGPPDLSRAGRSFISFFINRRWVNSRLLSWAVEEAYHGLMMTGKHPVAILNLTIPAGEIDVNVHPAKTEVKFSNEPAVFTAVQRAVRQALLSQAPVPGIEEVAVRYTPTPAGGQLSWDRPGKAAADTAESAAATTPAAVLPVLWVLGQFRQSYIVAEGPPGLYLIDQHAAHERICFEKVMAQRSAGKIEVQGLLEPAIMELSPAQSAKLNAMVEELGGFGFAVEAFGEHSCLVRSVPSMAGEGWREVFREMLDGAEEVGCRREESIARSLACHGAIRAGQVLTNDEMRELVRQLEQAAVPHACPHGRPTMIQISAERVRKEFGRI